MASFRLSRRADTDLGSVADYTIDKFGEAQARTYRDGLLSAFRLLSENQQMGRLARPFKLGLYRFEHESHVIFYRPEADGILVVRVLPQSMDHPQHLPDSDTK